MKILICLFLEISNRWKVGENMGIYTIKNNGTEQTLMGWSETEERLKELTDLAVNNGYDVLEYQKMVQQAKERNYVDFDEWLSRI